MSNPFVLGLGVGGLIALAIGIAAGPPKKCLQWEVRMVEEARVPSKPHLGMELKEQNFCIKRE